MKRKSVFFLILLLTGMALCACGRRSEDTEIKLSGTSATVSGAAAKSVKVENGTVTITRSGTYQISGSAKLQLIVDVEGGKAVYLNLNGMDLSCDTSSPVWIKNATLVCISLKSGSQNTITDRHLYVPPEEKDSAGNADATDTEDIPSAAIYSRAPLLFEGKGKLTVNAESYNGISTSDTFTMKSGNLTITAEHHGIKGKDYVVISDGNLNIKCEGDGIKSTNTDKPSLGYVTISGGNFYINADDEGIYAPSSISVSAGNLTVKSKKTAFLTLGTLNLKGGYIDILTDNPPLSASRTDLSADVQISVNGHPYKP